ncbi:hypothetical protein H0E87_030137, partial [Populus deltoides]
MGGDIGTVQTEVQGLEHGVGEERISSHAEAANDILSMTGLRGDALQSKLRIKQAVQVLQQSNVADNLVADVAKIQMGTNVGASPSGGNDIDNAISTSPHEQNNEADNLAGDAQDMNEVEIYNFLMKDNTVNGAGGVAQPGINVVIAMLYSCSRASLIVENVTIAIDVSMSDRENGTGEVAEKLLDAGESSRPGEKSGWTLLMTNLTLEFASAVSDQLSYALIGMVLAYVALLLATAELILYMARKKIMSLLPCFHRRSTSPSAPAEAVEYFGLF